jgi:hypothetical protein
MAYLTDLAFALHHYQIKTELNAMTLLGEENPLIADGLAVLGY